MREKIRYLINKVCDGIELLIAIAAVLALLYTGVAYAITKLGIYPLYESTDSFLLFLKEMFNLVVGIEFIKMLLKPSAENVIEVLVFLIARHLIIGENTVLGILVSVVCVILLYGFNYLMHKKRGEQSKTEEKDTADTLN